MQVLICDDDAITRMILRRKLAVAFSCDVVECRDGADALRRLEAGSFDLVVLDVDMPVIDGIAVLESIRRSPRLSHLSVMMASKERRADVVSRLVALGISAYILKPLRAEALNEAFERWRTRPRINRLHGPETSMAWLSADSPALIVDGDAHYRRFFVAQAHRHGPVREAMTGAEALAAFRETPTALVFVGEQIGAMTAEALAQKLRAESSERPPVVVSISSARGTRDGAAWYDEHMRRTIVAGLHQAELQRFVLGSGALLDACRLVGDLSEIVIADAVHLLTLMLDTGVQCGDDAESPDVSSTVTVELEGRLTVLLAVHATEMAARVLAARVANVPAASIPVEQPPATLAEIARLLSTRLQATAHQRQLSCHCAAPSTAVGEHAVLPLVTDDNGFSVVLRMMALGASLRLTVMVSATEPDSAPLPESPELVNASE